MGNGENACIPLKLLRSTLWLPVTFGKILSKRRIAPRNKGAGVFATPAPSCESVLMILGAVHAAPATSGRRPFVTMLDNTSAVPAVNEAAESSCDFVWSAEEIGRVIGRSPRQVFHLLVSGEIKSARKVGGRWVASRAALLREFGAT